MVRRLFSVVFAAAIAVACVTGTGSDGPRPANGGAGPQGSSGVGIINGGGTTNVVGTGGAATNGGAGVIYAGNPNGGTSIIVNPTGGATAVAGSAGAGGGPGPLCGGPAIPADKGRCNTGVVVAKGSALMVDDFEDPGVDNDYMAVFFGDGRSGKWFDSHDLTHMPVVTMAPEASTGGAASNTRAMHYKGTAPMGWGATLGITVANCYDARAYQEAFQNIREEPAMFAYSCLVRVGRLWAVLPHQLSAAESPSRRAMRYAVAIWYAFELLLAAIGLWILKKQLLAKPWIWGLLLLVSFTGVHALYWTDMRMRAPLTSVIALLAAQAVVVLAQPSRRASAVTATDPATADTTNAASVQLQRRFRSGFSWNAMFRPGCRSSSQRGKYQLWSPSRASAAGTRTPRTMVASISTAEARPTPIIFSSIRDSVAKIENTATMMTAALVTWEATAPAPTSGSDSLQRHPTRLTSGESSPQDPSHRD